MLRVVEINIQVIYFFAELAQSVERKTFNLVAVGSSPTFGIISVKLQGENSHIQ